MHINELLRAGTVALEKADVVSPGTDARVLLQHCLGKNRIELLLHGDENVEESRESFYFKCIARRVNHEPVAYILGQCEFWSLPFNLTNDVLIPRPETEFLLDRVLTIANKENLTRGRILDLCCGSGVISVVLARETGQRILAVDISPEALAVAAMNRDDHALTSRIDLLCSDLCSALCRKTRFSLIVTNPPYVSTSAIQYSLEKDVAGFEPHLALDGGEKGLDVIGRIRAVMPLMLLPGGEIFMEIGADQGEAVENIFLENETVLPGFVQVKIITDYAGLDRVLYAQLEY
ncbi:release factor glutamine methyltransferase [Desulfomarina profundi]|uniref:Release factor glutamine methyltransferase n=1 Tax=Desulfomarina profundi TaxID=2772557 RepID=A0A8D5JCW7_9BACT|nr:peptide chain release factor N(5)-glutamine methyltransferase [Desulfomarina profundi]BCL60198.1 release factor glutamine methyltransferase [Desulfomarina profundi]